MTKNDMDSRPLETRMQDLETYCNHLHTVLIDILENAPPPKRANYALLALAYRFSSADEDLLYEFLRWAHIQHRSGALTKKTLLAEFQATMPEHLQGKLEQILKAYEADGTHPDLIAVMFGR